MQKSALEKRRRCEVRLRAHEQHFWAFSWLGDEEAWAFDRGNNPQNGTSDLVAESITMKF